VSLVSLFGLGWRRGCGLVGAVGEVFVARVVAGGKVTIPLLVREVLKIKEGDYVRINISQVIKKKQQKEKTKEKSKK
jgi:bifunctional DNA-binding transcriptional regulator/antitoxin component of YhaV-PrlF toxin-antitoxin module